MQGIEPISPASRSAPIKTSIIVVVLGVLGLLTIMQWTASTVRKHVGIASHSLFPAALKSQHAANTFQRMNREYSDAVVMQEKKHLEYARREAVTAASSLDSASTSMEFNPVRQQQIIFLMRRVSDLQKRSQVLYAAAANVNGNPPRQEDLADLSRENKAVQTALETLQSDLASDFMAELALIDELLRIQGILEAALLVGLIIALFFSTRTLISATARRRGDVVLRRAHRDTEVLLNSVPSLLIGLDADGHIRQWNKAATAILGWEEATVPGKTLDQCGVQWLTPDISARVAACVQDATSNSLDDVRLEKNGMTRFLGLNALRLKTDGAAGILVVGADITERMRTEKSLNLLRMLMDQASDVIEVVDPDTLRFLDFNQRACLDSGYSREELLSRTVFDINPMFDTKALTATKEQLRKSGFAILETLHLRKDGSTFPVEVSIKHIVSDQAYWLCVVRDITDRQRLQQSQKLESIGQLAAGIAHEINTPTQYIGDNVRFLKDAFGELSSLLEKYDRLLEAAKGNALFGETVKEISGAAEHTDVDYLLEEIPKSIEQTLEGVARVAKLVGAMKDFSHPGTKDKILLDLNRAIESTITVARNEWKYVADMETDYDSSLPGVLCLPGEFNQVILILIVNAAHAIADVVGDGNSAKGKIKVQTRNCPGWCEIRIQDTGTGIPEKARARIFDPFFTTKEIGKGSGQGLAIARSVVVNKHGGTIHFETEEGKGTTFIVRLPHDGKVLAAKTVTA